VPIMAMILILLSPRRKESAIPFLIGSVGGLALVVTLATIIAIALPSPGARKPDLAGAIAQIVVGVALAVLSVIAWRRSRHAENTGDMPRWLGAASRMGRWSAFGLAVVLNVRPKALLLALAAGLSVRSADIDVGSIAIVLAVYVVIAASTVVVPIVAATVSPTSTERRLVSARAWLGRNSSAVTSVILLMVGVVIIGNGLASL